MNAEDIKQERGHMVVPMNLQGTKMIGSCICDTEEEAIMRGNELLIKGNGLLGNTVESVLITPCIKLSRK